MTRFSEMPSSLRCPTACLFSCLPRSVEPQLLKPQGKVQQAFQSLKTEKPPHRQRRIRARQLPRGRRHTTGGSYKRSTFRSESPSNESPSTTTWELPRKWKRGDGTSVNDKAPQRGTRRRGESVWENPCYNQYDVVVIRSRRLPETVAATRS